ncbi:hypothetical protein FHS18_005880 [Paenibacillus phyllosphaerae]|uniref:Uncharacterized protein n=1 Tax=Paenibacillus phyllosphaerae TaxID=274593 RepID=A0A7W5B3J4_9BACL|nr:hypothetical protein [Paenibacillus phyllosphaerae]MBB3113767.1 hypothetical protein [Paenibacillus phyllosphaerae]
MIDCSIAEQFMIDIRSQLALPEGIYNKTGILKGKDNFRYLHIARNNSPVWNLDDCMMKVRVYCNRPTLATRVEFGFHQDKANLSEIEKVYLRGVFHQYAKLHGLEEHRKYEDKEFYNVYKEFEGGPEEVMRQTTAFFEALLKTAEDFIDSMQK